MRLLKLLIKKISPKKDNTILINKSGSNIQISQPSVISNPENMHIGDNVYIGPNSWISCYTKVSIGSGTIIGPRIKIYTGNHNYDSELAIPYDNITFAKKVTIGENVWIGGDVTILPGVTIGEGCIVGASAVVTRDIAPLSIIGGNPAKVIKQRNEEKYFKLKSEGKIYLKLKKQGNFNPIVEKL